MTSASAWRVFVWVALLYLALGIFVVGHRPRSWPATAGWANPLSKAGLDPRSRAGRPPGPPDWIRRRGRGLARQKEG